MMRMISCGCFTAPECFEQKTYSHWLILYLAGLDYQQWFAPDGRMAYQCGPNPTPYLGLAVPEMKTRFRFREGRENWVLMFDAPSIRWDAGSGSPVWEHDAGTVALPFQVSLTELETVEYRNRMAGIMRLLQTALPRDRIAAECRTMEFLNRLLSPEASRHTPEERLRELIDRDRHWRKTLDELSREAGLGRDRLRQRFIDRYALTPGQYREERRLQEALRMIIYTELSIKEIAARLGMCHTTPFVCVAQAALFRIPGGAVAALPQDHTVTSRG